MHMNAEARRGAAQQLCRVIQKIRRYKKMDNLLEKIEQAEESALSLLPGYKISITNRQGR